MHDRRTPASHLKQDNRLTAGGSALELRMRSAESRWDGLGNHLDLWAAILKFDQNNDKILFFVSGEEAGNLDG